MSSYLSYVLIQQLYHRAGGLHSETKGGRGEFRFDWRLPERPATSLCLHTSLLEKIGNCMLRQKFLQRECCCDGSLSNEFNFMLVNFRNITQDDVSNKKIPTPPSKLLPFGGFNGIYRNPISELQPMRIIPEPSTPNTALRHVTRLVLLLSTMRENRLTPCPRPISRCCRATPLITKSHGQTPRRSKSQAASFLSHATNRNPSSNSCITRPRTVKMSIDKSYLFSAR